MQYYLPNKFVTKKYNLKCKLNIFFREIDKMKNKKYFNKMEKIMKEKLLKLKDLTRYDVLIYACKSSPLYVVKWLIELFDDDVKRSNNQKPFITACYHGNKPVISWLERNYFDYDYMSQYRESKNLIRIDYHVISSVFTNLCKKGNFRMIKFLYTNWIEFYEDNWPLIFLFENGYLHIIKWMFKNTNFKLDEYSYEIIFRKCCKMKNSKLLKYLIKKNWRMFDTTEQVKKIYESYNISPSVKKWLKSKIDLTN